MGSEKKCVTEHLLLGRTYYSVDLLTPSSESEYEHFFSALNLSYSRVFYGTWPDKNGRGITELLVEQVSHHPPITAYVIENKSKGLRLSGHNAQKTSFSCTSFIYSSRNCI